MKRSVMIVAFVAALAVVGGCKKKTAATPTASSAISGALSLGSFPAKPSAVEATDEAGGKVQSTIDAQGRFRLEIAKGHTYRLGVVLSSGSEPVVFPRTSKRLDTTVRVTTGAATMDLGLIRHFAVAPVGGFVTKGMPPLSTPTAGTGDGALGECVDGFVKGSGAPCADDDASGACESGIEAADGDGECENGKDQVTGAACVDSVDADHTTDADPSKPMAVPDHNAPNELGGCSDGGDGDGEMNDD